LFWIGWPVAQLLSVPHETFCCNQQVAPGDVQTPGELKLLQN
jgi:hypothetical protein